VCATAQQRRDLLDREYPVAHPLGLRVEKGEGSQAFPEYGSGWSGSKPIEAARAWKDLFACAGIHLVSAIKVV